MTNIQIEKARPQQVGIREVKKKRWKRIFTSHFSLHSQWESRKVKMPEVAASAPLTLDLIRPSRFGLRKTRTLWILPNSTPSDAARKKRLISVLVTKAAQNKVYIYSEKATRFCEVSTLILSVCTVDRSIRWRFLKILWPSQNI